MLRQKLQASRGNQGKSVHSSTADCSIDGFDNELRKVQNLVGDMQRQRHELSLAVSQLTLNSNPFAEPKKAPNPKVANVLPSFLNKRIHSDWTETDLDSLYTQNYGNSIDSINSNQSEEFGEARNNSPYHLQSNAETMQSFNNDDYSMSNGKWTFLHKCRIIN